MKPRQPRWVALKSAQPGVDWFDLVDLAVGNRKHGYPSRLMDLPQEVAASLASLLNRALP